MHAGLWRGSSAKLSEAWQTATERQSWIRPVIATEEERFSPQEPTERQQEFLALTCREALFGGAAGGGKSSALLMAALQYVHVPGYAALLLRRTFADLSLPGALMDRAQEWLAGTSARWEDRSKTWHFPSGASVTFGYLETEKDKFRYQSSEYQLVAFDEASQFTATQYTYLFSRLRRTRGVAAPLRMRAASNPGGVGHDWVKQRFIAPTAGSERVFVPSLLSDNPHLDADEYRASLQELDPVTRAQLLHGNWEIRPEGRMFRREWLPVVDAAPADLRRVRYWDLAATEAKPGKDPDYTCGALLGRSGEGKWYLLDMRRIQGTPGDVRRLMRTTAERDGTSVRIYLEQEPGSAGVFVVDETIRALAGWSVEGVKTTGGKSARAAPFSSQCEAGNVFLLRGAWNEAFWNEAEGFPDAVTHDDQVDAASGAFAKLVGGGKLLFFGA